MQKSCHNIDTQDNEKHAKPKQKSSHTMQKEPTAAHHLRFSKQIRTLTMS